MSKADMIWKSDRKKYREEYDRVFQKKTKKKKEASPTGGIDDIAEGFEGV